MNDQPGSVVLFAVLGVGVLWAISTSLYRRRASLAGQMRFRVLILGSYLLTLFIAAKFTDPGKALLIAILVGAAVGSRAYPRRTRYISRRDRRKAIAKFEISGERYDSKKHEIDHVVPYSRGGGNTAENLKVIPRGRNRSKGNRAPWWDVLGR